MEGKITILWLVEGISVLKMQNRIGRCPESNFLCIFYGYANMLIELTPSTPLFGREGICEDPEIIFLSIDYLKAFL